MKYIKILPVFLLSLFIVSCSSINVSSDYDKSANFAQHKTYGFHKEGVDKAEISDLDKKRILRAIDQELANKGLSKSTNPDLIVNIFTKERTDVNVYNYNAGFGMGWGWGYPGFYGSWGWPGWNNTSVSTTPKGTLFIDVIDAKSKELIWQGVGQGTLSTSDDVEKREKKIQEFVSKILAQYPPKSN